MDGGREKSSRFVDLWPDRRSGSVVGMVPCGRKVVHGFGHSTGDDIGDDSVSDREGLRLVLNDSKKASFLSARYGTCLNMSRGD